MAHPLNAATCIRQSSESRPQLRFTLTDTREAHLGQRNGCRLEGMECVTYRPIGVVRSPFKTPQDMPIQPVAAEGVEGRIDLLSEFSEGLQDLEGFSHVVLIYHLHRSRGFALLVRPFLDDELRGVFATRAPRRPNPIGLSVVRLVAIEATTLHIRNVDIVDNTPLLDLKPHIPGIDPEGPFTLGWVTGKTWELGAARSDDRFDN